MSSFTEWAEVFSIFAKYQPEGWAEVAVEHDEIWAGPKDGSAPISEEDKARLLGLGWSEPEEEGYGWYRSV